MADIQTFVRTVQRHLRPSSVSTQRAERLACSVDLWPRHLIMLKEGREPTLPGAVVWPESSEDISKLIQWAAQLELPLIPYGAGSSVVGGAWTDSNDTVVIDLKRMKQIFEIDAEAGIARVQAGMMGELYERQLNRAGMTQGHFPSSIYCSTVGGWVGGRGAGQMSSRYGKIEDQILGLKLIDGNGHILEHSPAVARTPWLDHMVGAEGTLGIVSELSARIYALPQSRHYHGFSFPNLDAAMACSRAWVVAGLNLCVLRVYDPLDTLLHRQTHDHGTARDKGPSWLAAVGANIPKTASFIASKLGSKCRSIIGLQGDGTSVKEELCLALAIAKQHGATDLGADAGKAWFEKRYAVGYKQSNALRAGVLVDTMEVACPWERVIEVYSAVRKAGLARGAQVLAHFSHAYLDGSTIYFTYATPLRIGEPGYFKLWQDALGAAVAAGANISHHHGSGKLKRGHWAIEHADDLDEQAELKNRYDPGTILNRNVFAAGHDSAGAVKNRVEKSMGRLGGSEMEADRLCSEIEEQCQSEGITLGAAVHLVGGQTLRQRIEAGHAFRFSPQLRVLEPLVSAIADFKGRSRGPRGATGPNVVQTQALKAKQVWLRNLAQPKCILRINGDAEALVQQALKNESNGNVAWCARLEKVQTTWWASLYADTFETQKKELEAWAETHKFSVSPVEKFDLAPADNAVLSFQGLWEDFLIAKRGHPDISWRVLACDRHGVLGLCSRADESWLKAQRLRPQVFEERVVAPELMTAAEAVAESNPRKLELYQFDKGHEGEIENCTYCPKLCRFSCSVAVGTGSEALTPRQLVLRAGMAQRGLGVEPDEMRGAYACSDCGGCQSYCGHGNDVPAVLQSLRRELQESGQNPPEIQRLISFQNMNTHLPDRPKARMTPTRDLAGGEAGVFLGCQNESEDQAHIDGLVQRLFGVRQDWRLAAPALGCCGQALWRWGDAKGFREHAQKMKAATLGLDMIVVDDPGCAHTMGEKYRELAGVEMPKIVSVSEYLLDAGQGDIQWTGEGPWTEHRSCAERKWSPTNNRLNIVASKENSACSGSVLGEDSGCCGGMLLPHLDADWAQRVAKERLTDLKGGGAKTIVCTSSTCRRRLRSVGADVLSPFEIS